MAHILIRSVLLSLLICLAACSGIPSDKDFSEKFEQNRDDFGRLIVVVQDHLQPQLLESFYNTVPSHLLGNVLTGLTEQEKTEAEALAQRLGIKRISTSADTSWIKLEIVDYTDSILGFESAISTQKGYIYAQTDFLYTPVKDTNQFLKQHPSARLLYAQKRLDEHWFIYLERNN